MNLKTLINDACNQSSKAHELVQVDVAPAYSCDIHTFSVRQSVQVLSYSLHSMASDEVIV